MTATAPIRPAHERFTERQRHARRVARRRLLIGALVLAALGAVAWLVWFSPLLAVGRVEVVGASKSEASAVRRSAAIELGAAMVGVDTEAIGKRVTQGVRAVGSVDVERSWPSQITITVAMRTPAVVLKDGSGQHLASADGTVYADVTSAPRKVPVVQAGRTAPTAAGLAAVPEVLAALPQDLRSDVRNLTVTGDDVSFRVGGVDVTWGTRAAMERKAMVLQILLKTQPTPELIDVSAPSTPVTR